MKHLRSMLVLLLLPFGSFAWDSVGHSTCGAIAYYYLRDHDPAVLDHVLAILKKHPWNSAHSQWSSELSGHNAADDDVILFMLTSCYPDELKTMNAPDQHRDWHFVNYPLVAAGAHITAPPPKKPNAETKVSEFMESIPHQPDPRQQAIDLCWLFHLTEDIHQPLHTCNMYDENHPKGDGGGGETYITIPPQHDKRLLHQYWDHQIKVKGKIMDIARKGRSLLDDPRYKISDLNELNTGKTVHDWVFNESFELAKKSAYVNGTVTGTLQEPTQVNQAYNADALKIAERRVVLAGIRLARELETMFPAKGK